jgi:hypothetical protein
MRRVFGWSAAAIVLSTTPAAAQARVDAVKWLTACWEAASPTRRIVERWKPAAGGEMRGDSRTVAGAREVEGERLRIFAKGDTLVYDAHPSGQARTEFRAPSVAGDSVVFANPAHDFPQRIIYKKVGADSLIARIEGDRAGRRQPTTYSYRRIDCAGVSDAPSDAIEAVLRTNYAELATMLDVANTGLNSWFAKFGGPDFSYVFWSTAGYRPPVVSREQVDRTVAQQAQQAANPPATPPATAAFTDRVNLVNVERVLVRGDTAEVLATMVISYKFVDGTARYGPANEKRLRQIEHRRLDRWTKRDGKWMLTNAALVADEMSVDGKLVSRNGKTLEP